MLARTVKDAPSTPVPGVYLGTFNWHLSDTRAALGCVLLNSTPDVLSSKNRGRRNPGQKGTKNKMYGQVYSGKKYVYMSMCTHIFFGGISKR